MRVLIFLLSMIVFQAARAHVCRELFVGATGVSSLVEEYLKFADSVANMPAGLEKNLARRQLKTLFEKVVGELGSESFAKRKIEELRKQIPKSPSIVGELRYSKGAEIYINGIIPTLKAIDENAPFDAGAAGVVWSQSEGAFLLPIDGESRVFQRNGLWQIARNIPIGILSGDGTRVAFHKVPSEIGVVDLENLHLPPHIIRGNFKLGAPSKFEGDRLELFSRDGLDQEPSFSVDLGKNPSAIELKPNRGLVLRGGNVRYFVDASGPSFEELRGRKWLVRAFDMKSMTVSPDTNRVILSYEGYERLLNLTEMKIDRDLPSAPFRFSQHPRYLYLEEKSGEGLYGIQIYDIDTEKSIHLSSFWPVQFIGNKAQVLYSPQNGIFEIYDLATQKPGQRFAAELAGVSPSGRYILTLQKKLSLWEAK